MIGAGKAYQTDGGRSWVTEQGAIPPSGKRQKTPSAFIFDYENGKLKESRNYFDVLTLLKQIGAA